MDDYVARKLVSGVGMAAAIFLAWLIAGRKVAAPASAGLPQTFVASRFIALLQFGFSLVFALSFSLAGADIVFVDGWSPQQGRALMLGIGFFMLLLAPLLWFGVKLFGTMAIWPDRLTLDQDGISGRIRGKSRRWSWDQIVGVRITAGRANMVSLVLNEPDPDRARFLACLPWGRRTDARIMPLDNVWKPTALLTSGEMAVGEAIKSVLDARGRRQTVDSQAVQ